MFAVESRTALCETLIAAARRDPHVTAAALVGSGATGRMDAWSDIDLAFRLAPGVAPLSAAESWTATMYEHGAVHHLDVWAAGALYRVFLLASSLQVDLSFWRDGDFRATEPGFALLFGAAGEPTTNPAPKPDQLAGLGWLYALHARSAIARGRHWQAVLMLDGVRDQIIALACVRHGLNPHQGRGVDQLPADVRAALIPTRARDVEQVELRRSLTTTITLLLNEIRQYDPNLADRLAGPAAILGQEEQQ
jgi:hypothetical protein